MSFSFEDKINDAIKEGNLDYYGNIKNYKHETPNLALAEPTEEEQRAEERGNWLEHGGPFGRPVFPNIDGNGNGNGGNGNGGNGHDDKNKPTATKSIPIVTEEDINFVITTIKKEAAYDEPSIKQLFYGMCTALTKLGMGHKVNSRDSGSGKSYLLGKVASYFPKKHVLILQGASDKAFQHRQGELVIKDEETGKLKPVEPMIEELEDKAEGLDPNTNGNGKELRKIQKEINKLKEKSQKLVNLDNTITLIWDTPQDNLLSNLMSLVSQDGEEDSQEYIYTNDKLQGKSNVLQGMPVIFYTRVIDDTRNLRAEEIARRFVNVSPNSTKEKIREANRIISKRYGLLPEEFDYQIVSNDDKQRAKEIVANLVEHLKVHTKHLGPKESGIRIVFEETLGHTMPYDVVFQMTVFERLERYLSIITKAKMCSRPRFVHRKTGAFYPVPDYQDLKDTFGLMETAGSNVRPYLAVMYNEVIYPLYDGIEAKRTDGVTTEQFKGLRVQEIIDGVKDKLHFNISNKRIHDKYLTPMVELGLINWAKSELRGNEKIYYPADIEAKKVHSLFPTEDMRLVVTEKALYPTKYNIEQSYRIRSKLSSDGGSKNIFEIYRLEDHLGNEITIGELVGRYLNNPELCSSEGWHLPPYYSEGSYTVRIEKPLVGFENKGNYSPDSEVLRNLTEDIPPPRPTF